MNLYELLNVDPRASTEVIQAAAKVLAAKHHPDHGGDGKILASIIEARDTLVDPSKRKAYNVRMNKGPDKKVIGSYEVLKYITEGAMGRTYVARHTLTKKLACIKCCLGVGPEFEDVMLNEAGAAWDIRHYAFPAIREVMKLDDGALAIVMSYVPGPTLDQVVKHVGTIDPEHCGWIFERLLAGLSYLHANGVVHGDIKPQNIIIQPESHGAVMIDFGLSMVKPTSNDHNIGYTNHFSPPEQLTTDRKPLIPETDLYSLGMTMIYAATGKLATRDDPMPKLPAEFRSFLRKLTDPRVSARPNWQSTDILREVHELRTKGFGTRNTRGKKFHDVPYDVFV